MVTVYYAHNSFKQNGDYMYNTVEQSFPEDPDMDIEIQDYGHSVANIWPSDFTVQPMSKRKRNGDLFRITPYLIISEKAYFALYSILKENGEFLNVQCKEIDALKAYNPLKCLDVLNKDNCEFCSVEVEGLEHSIKVLGFDFIEERITAPIFRINEDSGLFVTDEFVELVRRNNLKGFGFRRLWNSKEGRIHSRISLIGDEILSEEEDYNW